MRIGELARRTGLSRDTIRFYERNELIASSPSREATNSYRDYPEGLIERLEMIVTARDAGMSIADLALLFSHLEGGTDADFDADAFIDRRIAELKRSIAQARRFLKLLEDTRAAFDKGPVEWRDKD